MVKIKEVSKAKLFIGILYNNKNIYDEVLEELTKKFGPLEEDFIEYDFDKFTNYYEKEIGKNLLKKIIVFKNLIEREELAEIKVFTNDLEEKYSVDNKRTINLDPGYLTKEQLVLASVKESPYKVYIGKGIFAHLTYYFGKNKVIEALRTFPDFRDKKVQEFFVKIKNKIYN